MKGSSRLVSFAVPIIAVLAGLVAYQYGYLAVKNERVLLSERQVVRWATLERYVNLIAERPLLEKSLEALKERRNAEAARVIPAETLSIAAAALQDIVKGSITGRGGSIASERVERPEDQGRFKVVSVSVDAVLPDTRALSDVLYTLETNVPYLVINEVDTRVRNFRDPRDLMVKIRVSALASGK
jgi:hypothetical protein